MHIKNQLRILAFDDGPFNRRNRFSIVIGVAFRGGEQIDGVLKTRMRIDGFDGTDVLTKTIKKTKFKDTRIIMLDGITYAGFNVIDIKELSEKTDLPIIAVMRKYPKIDEFLDAMKKLPNFQKRYEAFLNAGKIYSVNIKNNDQKGKLFFQKSGISISDAKKVINISIKTSLYPEPLRIAHLIATGVVLGESIGRA